MRIALVAWLGMPHTRRFAEFYAQHGHDVHVVTCGGPLPVGAEPSFTVHDLGPPRGGKVGYLLKIAPARRLLGSLAPDLVHAHTATSYGLIALRSGIRPLVVTTHGSDVLLSPRTFAMRQVVRRVLLGADLITAPADHMRVAIEEIIAPHDREVLVFQYGVEVERLAGLGNSIRAERTQEATPRLVTARPLTSLYRTDRVLEALRLLDGWELDIAGDGPERRRLEALAAALEVNDRVRFHGVIDESAVHRLVALADFYVSMAVSDGVSIALLEALALGTVPVLADIAPSRAWVDDGVNGALTAPTPAGIADAVGRARTLDAAAARDISLARVRARGDRETNLGQLLERFGQLDAASARLGGVDPATDT